MSVRVAWEARAPRIGISRVALEYSNVSNHVSSLTLKRSGRTLESDVDVKMRYSIASMALDTTETTSSRPLLRRRRLGVEAGHEHYKWWALSCTSLGMLLAT